MEKYDSIDLFNDIEDFREAEKEKEVLWKKAIEVANIAHEGQTRDEGTPYIEHVIRVANRVIKIEDDIDSQAIIALLHDTIEDSSITYDFLEETFGILVADGVNTLSKNHTNGTEEQEREYLKKILNNRNPFLSIIKLIDRIDNVQSLDKCPDNDKVKRYKDKTKNIFIHEYKKYDDKNWEIYTSLLNELIELVNK